MSEDRIRRSFDELRDQASGADPEVPLMSLNQPASPRIAWIPALAAAAVIIVAVGAIGFLFGRVGGDDVVTPLSTLTPTTPTTIADSSPPSTGAPATTGQPSATTTPAVDTSDAPSPDREGWAVTGVASDDVLNVREGPGASFPIVGELAHDATGITVLADGTTPFEGSPWNQVLLADGTRGFVNSEFLRPPTGWLAGVDEVPCTAAETTAAASGTGGDANSVIGLEVLEAPDCTRYVVVLGRSGEVLTEAAGVAGDVTVTSGTSRVEIALPAAISDVAPRATNAWLAEGVALVVQPVGSTEQLEVHVLHDSARLAGVHVLANPARIVVDVASAPSGTGIDYSPVLSPLPVILETHIDPTVDRLGVATPVTVRGYARFFEAQGSVTVTTGGVSPTDIGFSGPSITFVDGNTAGVMAPWLPTWGEFEFQIDLPAGSYELEIGSCAATEAPCTIVDTFDVAP